MFHKTTDEKARKWYRNINFYTEISEEVDMAIAFFWHCLSPILSSRWRILTFEGDMC